MFFATHKGLEVNAIKQYIINVAMVFSIMQDIKETSEDSHQRIIKTTRSV